MTARYVADTDGLGLGRPDHEPLASETIGEIVELIESLVERGHAYEVDGDVYFKVRSYPEYGELSHRKVDDMDQGEGLEGAQPQARSARFRPVEGAEAGRGHRLGLALGSRAGPAGTSSARRWPRSCSGSTSRSTAAASDLLFPHHENEAAQTARRARQPLARLWVHNGMIRLDQDKMSKSVGNIFVLAEALAEYGRDALIMYFCAGHYRQPVEFNDERLVRGAEDVRTDPRGRAGG